MLFTIGYQNLKTAQNLIDILKSHGIDSLVDVRSKPGGRNAAFRKTHLRKVLPAAGIAYIWAGRKLGGFGTIEEADIRSLCNWQKSRRACLMCMEADPDRCHRKNEIGRRSEKYGVKATHIRT